MRIKYQNFGIKISKIVVLCGLIIGGVGFAAAQAPVPEKLASEPAGEFAPGEVIVKFEPGISMSMSHDLMGTFNAQYVETVYGSDIQVWRVTEGQELAVIEQLNADPSIAYAEPNYVYSIFDTVPTDSDYPKQWAHTKMQSPKGWDLTTGSATITIAVIDTGIDEIHPELASKIVSGWDFVDSDSNPHDTNGHGTHVAGIAAAIANNGGIAGVSWGARVMPIRVLGTTGSGYTTDITAGVNWARQNGADVINLSLGGTNYNQAMQDAVTAAHNAGVVVIAAMGNSYSDGNPVMYPAAYNNVFAVAATGPNDEKAAYSQTGSHCDIAAPGGNMSYLGDTKGIYSAMPTYSVYLNTAYGYLQNYDYLHGTSQATPQVSGLAALILSVDPTMAPSAVETLIEDTAVDLGTAGWDQTFGHGRIDIFEALKVISAPVAPVLSMISNLDGDGNYTVDWNDVANADSYTLQEANNLFFSGAQIVYNGSASQASINGKPSGTWYYRVMGSNASGNSAWSNVVSVTVKPEAPTLNAINNPGNLDAYTISWSASTGADGYKLQEDDNAAFSSPETRYMGSALVYSVTGQVGGTWYYRVLAYNDGGDSPWSTPQSTTVTPSSLLSPVLNSISNPENDGDYAVNWSSVSGATAYILEESSSPYFESPTEVYSGSLTQFDVTDQDGGTWYYRARAANATDSGPWSNWESTLVNTEIFLPLVAKNFASVVPSIGIINGNFDSGPTIWTEYSSHGWDIIVTSFPPGITPYSGSYAAWLGGEYNDISYVQQQVTISAGAPYLVYWHWIASADACGYDFGGVLVNGVVVDVYNLCSPSSTGGWVKHSVNLSAYVGQSVALQIRAETDSSANSNLFVDDVSLQTNAAMSEQNNKVVLIRETSISQDKIEILVQGETPHVIEAKRLLHP